MSVVVTTGAMVTCTLQGTVSQPGGRVKLSVSGAGVALASATSSWTTAGCQAVTPNGSKSPCDHVSPPTAGTATKLRVSGSPVLLEELQAVALTGTVPDPVAHTVSVASTASATLKAS